QTPCPSPADACSQGSEISPEILAIDPSNRSNILIGTVDFFKTTITYPSPTPNPSPIQATWLSVRKQDNFLDLHVDVRAIAFSQATPGLVYVGNDGGVWRSVQGGQPNSWENLNQSFPGMLLNSVAIAQ